MQSMRPAWDLMLCMPSQHHALGLQTFKHSHCLHGGCAGACGEASRLPRVCPMSLGYGCPRVTMTIPLVSFQQGKDKRKACVLHHSRLKTLLLVTVADLLTLPLNSHNYLQLITTWQ